MPRFTGFCGGSYSSQSPTVANERCINWYPERVESPFGKNPFALYPTPGLGTFAFSDAGNCRGLFARDGRAFAVIGQRLQEVTDNSTGSTPGSIVDRGDVGLDDHPAVMDTNGDGGGELAIGSGGNVHILNLATNVLSANVAAGVHHVGFLDGHFVALDRNTSTFKQSQSLDGLTWDASEIAQRTLAGDKWRSLMVADRTIWLFGSETSEVWQNQNIFPHPPFGPLPYLIPFGIAAPHAVALMGGGPMWLTQNADGAAMVVRANGYAAVRVSDHGVEHAIASYLETLGKDAISDAVAFSYVERGHPFFVLNFPRAKATWAYDDSTGIWHERGFWNTQLARFTAWRPQFHCSAFGKQLFGDRESGTIYFADPNSGYDGGENPIRRVRRALHGQRGFEVSVSDPIPWRIADAHLAFHASGDYVFYDELRLDVQVGLGLSGNPANVPPVQGEDPLVMLRLSNDSGQTWGHELTCAAGRMGERLTRVSWNRLGRCPQVGAA